MKRLACLLLSLIILAGLSACGGRVPENRVFEAADIYGRIAGVMENSPAETYVEELGGNCLAYTDRNDLLRDLLSGKLDCIVIEDSAADGILDVTSRARKLESPLADEDYRIVVALENPGLTSDINAALTAMLSDGTVKSLTAVCLSGEEYPAGKAPVEGAESLAVAADPTFYPYCYYGDEGEITGLFPEIAKELCARLGLNAEMVAAGEKDFVSLVQSGRAAFAIGRIKEDPEAAAQYTIPFMQTRQVILVRK